MYKVSWINETWGLSFEQREHTCQLIFRFEKIDSRLTCVIINTKYIITKSIARYNRDRISNIEMHKFKRCTRNRITKRERKLWYLAIQQFWHNDKYLEEQSKLKKFKTCRVVEEEEWPRRACHTSVKTRSTRNTWGGGEIVNWME
jgi:hypothetical protein